MFITCSVVASDVKLKIRSTESMTMMVGFLITKE